MPRAKVTKTYDLLARHIHFDPTRQKPWRVRVQKRGVIYETRYATEGEARERLADLLWKLENPQFRGTTPDLLNLLTQGRL